MGIVLDDLEMKDCKSVATPMTPEDFKEAASVIEENGEIDEGEYIWMQHRRPRIEALQQE